jgi:transposase
MKALKHYALGPKIPSSVKPFSKQEIDTKQFSARHSSMLRILTKWAEYLEEIFKAPQQYVRRRLYSFRNIENTLVNLDKGHIGEGKLIRRLEEEYQEVKMKFKEILRASYGAIADFLGAESSC